MAVRVAMSASTLPPSPSITPRSMPTDVTLTATGAFQSLGSTVNASAKQGAGGTISIQAGNLMLTDGSTLTVQSEGAGNAGTIQLKAGHNIHLQDSLVTANSKGSGNAGT